MEEYMNLLTRLQQEQKELYLLREQQSIFAFISRNQITELIKQYDKAILHTLRKTETVMNEEYEFMQRFKEARS